MGFPNIMIKKLRLGVQVLITAVFLLLNGQIAAAQSTCSGSADLWFLNDESGSVANDEWLESKEFIKSVASKFTFSEDDFKGGLVVWSDSSSVKEISGLTTSFIDVATNYNREYSGGTDPANALEFVANAARLGTGRTNTPSVVVLMTDGRGDQLHNANSASFISAADTIRARTGSAVIVMLIEEAATAYNNDASVKTTIDSVAGSASNVVVGASYANIANPAQSYVTNLSAKICSVAANAATAFTDVTTSTITANPTSITADGTTTSTITVQLKDANSNNLSASGGTVVLSTDLGTLSAVTDNTNGTYTATLTSATTAGTATITGTLDGTAITDDATVTMTDVTPPTITGPDGSGGTTTGATSAISVDENQTAVTTVTADETVTWTLTGSDDDAKFAIDASTGVITFVAGPDFEDANDVGDTANNNTYVVEVTATDTASNTSTQTLTVTVIDVLDSLPGTVNGGDIDGDGIADSLESTTADRDGDGIVDASDYDPQGFLYCEDDGRILAGGRISVTGPAGSNSSVGTANNIRIVKDGSDGQYQWFVDAPGTYTMAVSYPTSVGIPSTTRTSSGTLDVTTLLPSNPASIGSSEFGTTNVLANYRAGYSLSSPAANTTTVFYETFEIEAGDPNVIGNNIPIAQCGDNDVTIAGTTNGAEANGGTPSQAVFTIDQGRISTEPTTVSYSVSGTATAGSDFTALSGSVTIPVGDTSATVTVSILEDVLIEGDETLVLTLTGITSGDLTTQLSATPSLVTASVDVVDDDFADIAVSNDDLNTTEGRTDDATMGFSLLGQPTGPVILTFAGDDQCTVSPSTMTFTASDFATPQALSISAINDELVEGTHSCQPTVTVTSADTRFNNFGLTLSAVTVADDLVDQIRNPLKDILQSDFEQTVATQSRQFSQISKGALGRLQSDEEKRCGVVEALDADGRAQAGAGGFNTSGVFGEEYYDCETGVRRILDGSFAINRSDAVDAQGIVSFTIQNEKQKADEALNGKFFGGYLSSSTLDGVATGNLRGVGVHAGLYGARKLQSGLFFDYYAAGGVGRHKYDVSFYAPSAPITAEGDYRYGAVYAGAALSGEAVYESVTFRPRVGFDLTYADASDASVSASQLGFTDLGSIQLDAINGSRIFAETIWIFGDKSEDLITGELSLERALEVAPRLYCEQGVGRDERDCGYGGYISFNEHNLSKGSDIAITLDYENNTEGSERFGLDLSYSRDVLNGAGKLATQFGIDASGNATVSQSLSLEF